MELLLQMSNAFHSTEVLSGTVVSHDEEAPGILVLGMHIHYDVLHVFSLVTALLVVLQKLHYLRLATNLPSLAPSWGVGYYWRLVTKCS